MYSVIPRSRPESSAPRVWRRGRATYGGSALWIPGFSGTANGFAWLPMQRPSCIEEYWQVMTRWHAWSRAVGSARSSYAFSDRIPSRAAGGPAARDLRSPHDACPAVVVGAHMGNVFAAGHVRL